MSAVLLGYAVTASADETQTKNESLFTTVIEWLQSRLLVPGG